MTPSGGALLFAPAFAGVEPFAAALPDVFEVGICAVLEAGTLASVEGEPVDWLSDSVASLTFAGPEPLFVLAAPFDFRIDAETIVGAGPTDFGATGPPVDPCEGGAGVGDFEPELLLFVDGDGVTERERKNDPPLCEPEDRSEGDPLGSADGLVGETSAATGMPTLFIVIHHSKNLIY